MASSFDKFDKSIIDKLRVTPSSSPSIKQDPPLNLTKEEAALPGGFKKYPGAMLIKSAASLWAKIDTSKLSKKEQRAKFDDLLNWFCKKNEYTLERNVPQKYHYQGKTIDGRISYKLSSDLFSCKVELMFDSDLSIAAKMKAAHDQEDYPIIIKVGAPSSDLKSACHGFMLVSV